MINMEYRCTTALLGFGSEEVFLELCHEKQQLPFFIFMPEISSQN